MAMTRRQFARSLGAGIVLLPFLPGMARAAGTSAPQRLIIITSLGIPHGMWTPTSAPGAPVQLSPMLAGLQPILPDIVLADGLSFANPTEGHSSPQTLTGLGFAANNKISVDQYIAKKRADSTKIPTFLLGMQAKNEGMFFANNNRIPPIDSPVDAFNQAFGAGASAASASPGSSAMPRKSILDLVRKQIADLQGGLGTQQRMKLDNHLASIGQLERALQPNASGCAAPAAPVIAGDPESDPLSGAVGSAHMDLIVNALACDVTRIAGMQWGVSNRQYIQSPSLGQEEHSMVHSGANGTDAVMALEKFLVGQFVNLVQKLKNRPDPSGSGTLLDNTLVVWTRDIGDGPNHLQYSMPYLLAGATQYLKTDPKGVYVSFGGSNEAKNSGEPHERLLLNVCEAMGVTDFSGFGSLAAGAKQPLAQLKRKP